MPAAFPSDVFPPQEPWRGTENLPGAAKNELQVFQKWLYCPLSVRLKVVSQLLAVSSLHVLITAPRGGLDLYRIDIPSPLSPVASWMYFYHFT